MLLEPGWQTGIFLRLPLNKTFFNILYSSVLIQEVDNLLSRIGIRKEDKNEWEKRTPLIPKDVKELITEHGIEILVQPSTIRVYSSGEYMEAGAEISQDISLSDIILGVKEIPTNLLLPGKTYVFFSHTLKGQHYNMPMLKRLLDLKCNLLDYERITDSKNRRLIFFGRHAGIAGMIDTIWALGEKLNEDGIENPFYEMRQTYKYRDLPAAIDDVKLIAKLIEKKGLPARIAPVVFGIAGYGNVSRGAQEILNLFTVIEIKPSELDKLGKWKGISLNHVYKVIFKEKDMAIPKDSKSKFELQDYYNHPKKYRGIFHNYLPHLSVLINAIYWTDKYPRLVTRDFTFKMWKKNHRKLQVIGDISSDINGGIEMNTHTTEPSKPVYIFEPITGNTKNGLTGDGFLVLAVDNLPCEIPKEASDYFSSILKNFIPTLARCDFSKEYDKLELSDELKKALMVHNGKLTRDYEYLKPYLDE